MEIVVLVDDNWGIGFAGDQLIRIKEDLQKFKKITDKGVVVYGRKTLDTFPKAKILKDRENWILSRTVKEVEGAKVFQDIDTLIQKIKEAEAAGKKVFCIGGTEIYEQLLPYVKVCHVSKVHKSFENVDRYFPNLDKSADWNLTEKSEHKYSESAGVSYSFNKYERRSQRGEI